MITIVSTILAPFLTMQIALAAEQDHRFARKFQFPAGREIAVVAEGEFEPRSIGSYSVRTYSGVNPKFPFDDFITGMIRPRNGAVENVRFHDFDGDGRAEIIVIIRSAGSGSYLSADAFAYADKSLKLLASVSDLPNDADPIPVLAEKVSKDS